MLEPTNAVHVVHWTHDDVETWRLKTGLPRDVSTRILAGLDGARLWYLTHEALCLYNDALPLELQLPLGELEIVWTSVSALIEHQRSVDVLCAIQLQAEDAPGFTTEGGELFSLVRDQHRVLLDHSYSEALHEHEVKRQRNTRADFQLASRLAGEFSFEGLSVQLARKEEQKQIDQELAVQLSNVDEARVQSIIEENGRDVLVRATNGNQHADYEERIVVPEVMTLAKLIDMRDSWFAEDVEIDCTKMLSWTEQQVNDYFESGGTAFPNHEGHTQTTLLQCVACLDECSDTSSLPCKHDMCKSCLKDLFNAALKDSSLLPVRCCSMVLPRELFCLLLDWEDERLLTERLQQMTARNKMYCANARNL